LIITKLRPIFGKTYEGKAMTSRNRPGKKERETASAKFQQPRNGGVNRINPAHAVNGAPDDSKKPRR
jgi:hypothetical protein